MLSGLIFTALLMGLGGIPHCAAMCGAPCAVAFPRGLPWVSLLGRCLGYALLGALAAASAGTVAAWGRHVSFLQPLWVLLLAAALVLGLHLLKAGRMPQRLDDWGQHLYRRARARWAVSDAADGSTARRPRRALLAGMAWVLMPCGLLYAALTVAALAPHAWGGALVMFAFAVPGAFGVWAAPSVLRRLTRSPPQEAPAKSSSPALFSSGQPAGMPSQAVPLLWMSRPDVLAGGRNADAVDVPQRGHHPVAPHEFDPRWAVRLSGLMLSGMAGWALYHQLLDQWRAWCA